VSARGGLSLGGESFVHSGIPSTLADLCTLCRMGKQTGLTTPNKCLPIKGHFASCGHAGARVGFAVNFEG